MKTYKMMSEQEPWM